MTRVDATADNGTERARGWLAATLILWLAIALACFWFYLLPNFFGALAGGLTLFLLGRLPAMKPVKDWINRRQWLAAIFVVFLLWVMWPIISLITLMWFLVFAAASLIPWKPALLLLAANPLVWGWTPVAGSTMVDYFQGDATYHLYGLVVGVYPDSIHPELKCRYTLKGCMVGGPDSVASGINNDTLTRLVKLFGPMKDSPVRDYPTASEAMRTLEAEGSDISGIELVDRDYRLKGRKLAIPPELVSRLITEYRIPLQSGEEDPFRVCWQENDLLLLACPKSTQRGNFRFFIYIDKYYEQLIVPDLF